MNERAPGSRLERALEAFLAAPPTSADEAERLLSAHPDLHEVLAPMVAAPTSCFDEQNDDGDAGPVLGDFRLVREVGRGGMGIVYEAWQRSLDRRVAVKVLPPGAVATPAAVARFRREAAAAARLRHPHIVEVHGFGSEAGQHFFAMQFVDGRSLAECMAAWRQPERAVALAAQLADALAHAHAQGVVHRDVKPANVLVDGDTALLTDFGVARDEAQPSLTRDGGFVGTLDYAAPEQLRGERVDARADVWSLGVILHELLSGTRPFQAATEQATMRNILVGEPAPLVGTPGVSRDLAAIVDRALQKQPTRRYASAAALLQDLRALQRGEPVTARLPSAGERLLRWGRREPWRALAATIALVAVPLLAGGAGYLWANAPRIRAAVADEQWQDREDRLSRAVFARTEARYDDAIAALAPLPADDPEIAFLRCWIHWSDGRDAEALAAIEGLDVPSFELARRSIRGTLPTIDELLQSGGDPLDCLVRSVLVASRKSVRGRTPNNRTGGAMDLVEQAMLLSPRVRASEAIHFALLAIESKDATAVGRAERILATHFPANPTAMRLRAMLLAETDAEAALRWIADLPPDPIYDAHLASARGRAMARLGDDAGAAAAHREALAIDDRRASDWGNLGVALRKQKQPEAAIEALQRAVGLRPRDPHYGNLLALALRDAGRLEDAERLLAGLLTRDLDYAPAAYNLGNLRMRRGDFAGAVAAFRRAVEIDPSDVRHHANLGDALARTDDLQEALVASLRAAELAPGSFVAHHNVARLALELGLPKLALRAAQQAQRAAPQEARAHELLAEVLLGQAPVDAAAATAAARKADARHNGERLEARVLVARALAAGGDRTAAIALLEAARQQARFADAEAQATIDRWLVTWRER
ncbi:MAG: protein kinase [Planctomycetes bacterium]|nr:protein kinase [Planctomycetota bacterium]